MNLLLWVVAIMLAAVFLLTAWRKFPPNQALERAWARGMREPHIIGIAFLETLAAVGLIAPGALHIAVVLTPLAALGAALLMVGAFVLNARVGDRQGMVSNVVIFGLALLVAWGRFGPYRF